MRLVQYLPQKLFTPPWRTIQQVIQYPASHQRTQRNTNPFRCFSYGVWKVMFHKQTHWHFRRRNWPV
jgi:hypothetical protein